MKTVARVSSLMMLLSWITLSATVPPESGDLCAAIPFAFVLDGKTMPAGNYLIRANEAAGNIEVCEDGVYCRTTTVTASEAREKRSKAAIVFLHDGATYHLSQLSSDKAYEVTRVDNHAVGSSSKLTRIDAHPVCIHREARSGRAVAWHQDFERQISRKVRIMDQENIAMHRRQFLYQASAAGILALAPVRGWPVETAKPFTEWSDKEKEDFLMTAKLVKTKHIKIGTTGTQRATLSNGAVTHDAQLQTVDIAKDRFTTAVGTELGFRDSYKFNVAAYRLDRLVGFNVVPVSVERRLGGKTGSVTWWVDDVQMMEQERFKKKIAPPNQANWIDQMCNARVFTEFVYNTDPNLGNFLITGDWALHLIDFTRAFRISKDLRTPKNLTRIDQRIYDGLRALDRASLERELNPLLRQVEIDGLFERRGRILAVFDDHIAKKGENRVICKRPGH